MNTTKRLIITLSAFLCCTSWVWADIDINETNFPDANFRNWLLEREYGADGVLTETEIAGIKIVEVENKNIQSLKGIEFFTAMTKLNCKSNQLKALDISNNTALTELQCQNNQLLALNMSKNIQLKMLECASNKLIYLDVTKNTELTELQCQNNQLVVLNVSNNTNLKYLYCNNNLLTKLDVSKNSLLIRLDCFHNKIKGVAMDALVESLSHVDNGEMRAIYNDTNEQNVMTAEQVAAAKAKGWIPYFYQNGWQEFAGSEPIAIDEINFPDAIFRNWLLEQEYGTDSVLTEPEIAGANVIEVENKNIQSLKGIEFFTSMTKLNCKSNHLTALNISNNTALTELQCQDNQLGILNVSKNTNLKYLNCNNNLLTKLDVSNNSLLIRLDCYCNKIKGAKMDALVESLSPVDNGEMRVIYNDTNEQNVMTTEQVEVAKAKGWIPYIYQNGWQEYAGIDGIAINVTNFPDANFRNWVLSQPYGSDGVLKDPEILGVKFIGVENKDIQSLKGIEFFTALSILDCKSNLLTELDVSKNTLLRGLDCSCNQLTALDLSKNTKLEDLYCYQNKIGEVAMGELVESLPTVSNGTLRAIYNVDEQNVMTTLHVATAKSKGWKPYHYNGYLWWEYAGCDPDGIEEVKSEKLEVNNEETIYNLAGQKIVNGQSSNAKFLDALAPRRDCSCGRPGGINIIRMSDGTTRKVMVK